MKLFCPGHHGPIYVSATRINQDKPVNIVVECPVCDDEVLINGPDAFAPENQNVLKIEKRS